jgi:hypothetical protein
VFFASYKRALFSLALIFLTSTIVVQASQPQSWERKHEQLKRKQGAAYSLLKGVYANLVLNIQEESPALLTQISLDPPERRATGYQLFPEIRDDAPQTAVVPIETFYSLKWLEDRFSEVLQKIENLETQVRNASEIKTLIANFNEIRDILRNLQNHLGYQEKWQKAITQYPLYFNNKNEFIVLVRAMKLLMVNGGSPERIANLRQHLLQQIAPFKPTPGLQLSYGDDGEMVLPVTVCTDIEDLQFLSAFESGVREAFSLSSAAQKYRFSIELKWRIIRPETLYGGNAPRRGSEIDVGAHYALFTGCPLVMTTGAPSLNARVGKRIFLGTEPVSRRTLAHEFGHLLGFEDAYLRGFDGDPGDPYGVTIVEWTGLSPDLMGDSDGGQVSSEMIEILVTAYGGSLPR